MLQRMGRGWAIAKASWALLRMHAKLLLFPMFLPLIGLGVAAGADAAIAMAFTAVVPYVQAPIMVTALGTIFRTGPYIFATTGKAPSCMDPVLLQAAFRKQQGSP